MYDVAIAYDIFTKGPQLLRERDGYNDDDYQDHDGDGGEGVEGCGGTGSSTSVIVADRVANNFFRMMRNKTMPPPNKGKKEHPKGAPGESYSDFDYSSSSIWWW